MFMNNFVSFQSFDFDLAGVALTSSDVLEVSVKDWERIGRNR